MTLVNSKLINTREPLLVIYFKFVLSHNHLRLTFATLTSRFENLKKSKKRKEQKNFGFYNKINLYCSSAQTAESQQRQKPRCLPFAVRLSHLRLYIVLSR